MLSTDQINVLLDNLCLKHDREQMLPMHILALAEESGEAVEAYRMWKGLHRKIGDVDGFALELADVALVVQILAHLAEIDLDSTLQMKFDKIMDRMNRSARS